MEDVAEELSTRLALHLNTATTDSMAICRKAKFGDQAAGHNCLVERNFVSGLSDDDCDRILLPDETYGGEKMARDLATPPLENDLEAESRRKELSCKSRTFSKFVLTSWALIK